MFPLEVQIARSTIARRMNNTIPFIAFGGFGASIPARSSGGGNRTIGIRHIHRACMTPKKTNSDARKKMAKAMTADANGRAATTSMNCQTRSILPNPVQSHPAPNLCYVAWPACAAIIIGGDPRIPSHHTRLGPLWGPACCVFAGPFSNLAARWIPTPWRSI